MDLSEYVMKYAKRGACTCGRCIDAPENPEDAQPAGHTVNLTFFEVSAGEGANKEDFLLRVIASHMHWLDGQEHGFIELGAELGDQGLALMTIGLGAALGVWHALSPDTVMPDLEKATKLQMAQMGMVTLMYIPQESADGPAENSEGKQSA